MKRSRAASIVASCSSSFEPKCAKRPLFDIASSSASRPMVSPSRPSTEARSTARSRMRCRVRSPFMRKPAGPSSASMSMRGKRRSTARGAATRIDFVIVSLAAGVAARGRRRWSRGSRRRRWWRRGARPRRRCAWCRGRHRIEVLDVQVANDVELIGIVGRRRALHCPAHRDVPGEIGALHVRSEAGVVQHLHRIELVEVDKYSVRFSTAPSTPPRRSGLC